MQCVLYQERRGFILIRTRQKGENNTHFVPEEVTVKDEIKAGGSDICMLVTNHNSLKKQTTLACFLLYFLHRIEMMQNWKMLLNIPWAKYIAVKLVFCCEQHCNIAFIVCGILNSRFTSCNAASPDRDINRSCICGPCANNIMFNRQLK